MKKQKREWVAENLVVEAVVWSMGQVIQLTV